MSAFNPRAEWMGVVTPGSWLAKRLEAICNPRKHPARTQVRVPAKSSPVYGLTSWERINNRRHFLIGKELAARAPGKFKRSEELEALQKVAGEFACGSLVAQNFCMNRALLRMRATNATT